MLRRKPTRLELKIDDTEEFESVKKELEVSHLISINQFWKYPSIVNHQYYQWRLSINISPVNNHYGQYQSIKSVAKLMPVRLLIDLFKKNLQQPTTVQNLQSKIKL